MHPYKRICFLILFLITFQLRAKHTESRSLIDQTSWKNEVLLDDSSYSMENLSVIVTGYALKFRNDNEETWGAGVAYDCAELDFLNTKVSAEALFFMDSNDNFSVALSSSFRTPLIEDYLSVGINVGLTYKEHLKDDFGTPIMPYAFPFLQFGHEDFLNLRVNYIPPIILDKSREMLFFQLYIPF